MAEEEKDKDDKTEEATEEQRKKYREQGNIPQSRELLSAIALLLFVLIIWFSAQRTFDAISSVFHRSWMISSRSLLSPETINKSLFFILEPLLPWILLAWALLLAIPVLVGLLLSKFNWGWEKFNFDMSKMNFFTGVQKIFGMEVIVNAVKSILKAVVVICVIGTLLKKDIFQVISYPMQNAFFVSSSIGQFAFKTIVVFSIFAIVYGVLDYGWNFFKLERDMRMSKQDIKEEIKGQEGDPHVRGARRRMLRSFLAKSNINSTPNATFIVTNPEHFSVAVRYVKGMSAPIVIAKGQDFVALKIREIARKHDIAIVENKPLARTLYATVKVGQEVPPTLFSSVIEVMKFIYKQRGKSYFEKYDLSGVMG